MKKITISIVLLILTILNWCLISNAADKSLVLESGNTTMTVDEEQTLKFSDGTSVIGGSTSITTITSSDENILKVLRNVNGTISDRIIANHRGTATITVETTTYMARENEHVTETYQITIEVTGHLALDGIARGSRTERDFTSVIDDINSYTNIQDTTNYSKLTDIGSKILTVITNIGIIISVLMSAILGVKYMLGSIEEKAEYKKDMLPYVTGAVLTFGVCTIVKILQAIGTSINS